MILAGATTAAATTPSCGASTPSPRWRTAWRRAGGAVGRLRRRHAGRRRARDGEEVRQLDGSAPRGVAGARRSGRSCNRPPEGRCRGPRGCGPRPPRRGRRPLDGAAHCSACGASFPTGVLRAHRLRCPSCGQVHRAEPDGHAYLAEDRVGAIAESVLDELLAVETARRSYTGWLHPVEDDFVSFERTVKKAWNRWADAVAPCAAGTRRGRAARCRAGRPHAGPLAERRGPGSAPAGDPRLPPAQGGPAARGPRPRPRSNMGASRFIEDVCVCLHEHDDRTSAWHGLALLHHVRRIAEDRDAWMRRRISEFDESLRTR